MKKNEDYSSYRYIILVIIFITILLLTSIVFVKNSEAIKMLFFLAVYLLLTFFYFIRRKESLLSIKTMFVVLFTVFIGLSPIFYYLNHKTFQFSNGAFLSYQYVYIIISYILLIVGLNIGLVEKKNITKNNFLILQKKYAIALLTISTLVNFIYVYNNLSLLSGNLNDGRIQALTSNGIFLVLSNLYIIGISLLYDYYLNTKKSKKTLILFIILNIIFFFIRGSRLQIINIFIVMILLYNHHCNINLKKMFMFFICIVFSISLLQVGRNAMSGKDFSLTQSMYDTFQVGSININYIYNTFPNRVPFQYGKTYLINIKMLLPGPDLDFTLWLKQCLNLQFSGGGVTPTIIGEGYINFGILGIIFVMIFTGLLGSKLSRLYEYDRKNIAWICVYTTYVFSAFKGGYCNLEIIILTIFVTQIFYNFLCRVKGISKND